MSPRGAGIVIATLLLLMPAGPAAGQGAVRSVDADWQVRCDTPPARRASNVP